MDFREIIKVYDENFSFFKTLIKSVKDSKVIIIPYSLILISAIGLYFTYINSSIPNRIWVMIVFILIYIASIIWVSFIQGISIKRKYGSNYEFQKYKLNEVDNFIKDRMGLKTVKQYELLDSLIKKEIEICKDIKRFPFSNTIKQLFVAVLITGLLSYSFKEITSGNEQIGFSLLRLYILIIGTIIMIGTIIYSLRNIGKVSKLKHISRIISELLIGISKREIELDEAKKEGNEKVNSNKKVQNKKKQKK